jgi:nitrous oxide reductase accessory protein NosL
MQHSFILTALGLTLALSACDGEKSSATPTPVPSTSASTTSTLARPPGDLPRPPGSSLPAELRPPTK